MNESHDDREGLCVHLHLDADRLLTFPPHLAEAEIRHTLSLCAEQAVKVLEQKRADRAAVQRLIGE